MKYYLVLLAIILASIAYSEKSLLRNQHKLQLNDLKKKDSTTTTSSSSSSSSSSGQSDFDTVPDFMKISSKDFCAKHNAFVLSIDDGMKAFGVKQMDPWKDRICDQHAAYFYDKLDPVFEKQIIEEWNLAVTSFINSAAFNNSPPVVETISTNASGSVKKTSKVTMSSSLGDDKKISLPQLVAGASESGWLSDLSETAMQKKLKKYDTTGDNALFYKEFVLFLIDEWRSADENTFGADTCKHCLLDSRKKLGEMFRFFDCDDDGMISSEDIYNGMKHFKYLTENELSPACTNDVVLKSDANSNAKLTLPEWQRAVYVGYWQRMTDMKGINKTYKLFREMRVKNKGKTIIKNPPYIYGDAPAGVSAA